MVVGIGWAPEKCHGGSLVIVLAFPCDLKVAMPLQKSSQSPQQPSSYVLFARICLLAEKEAEKESVWPGTAHIVSHTKLALCWQGKAGWTVYKIKVLVYSSSCHWSLCFRYQLIFLIAHGDPLLVGQLIFWLLMEG